MSRSIIAPWARFGGRALGTAGCGLMVAAIIAAPFLATMGPKPTDEDLGEGAVAWNGDPGAAEVLDLWLPDDFESLADQVQRSGLAEPERLQALLKSQGRADVWYAAKVRRRMGDGRDMVLTYVRHPSDDLIHAREFLELLSEGLGERPGEAVDVWKHLGREVVVGLPANSVHRLSLADAKRSFREVYDRTQAAEHARPIARRPASILLKDA